MVPRDLSSHQIKQEFVDFLTSYTDMLTDHLKDLQREMEVAVVDVMKQVSLISDTSSEEAGNAVKILSGENGEFKEVDAKEKIQKELARVDGKRLQEQMGQSMLKAGNKLKADMALLSEVDDKIKTSVFNIIGLVSNDDVVRQRLEHVGAASVALQVVIKEIYTKHENISVELIEKEIKELNEKVLKSFTMEVERVEFRKIFS
ncbi:MAG: hypothetical protein WCI18_14070 [Pseudomonadota bacterium]